VLAVERMPVDQISHNALHARFRGNRSKGRPRLRWIDNINWRHDITWSNANMSNGLNKWPRTMKVIYWYPLPPNSQHRELSMVMMIMMMSVVMAVLMVISEFQLKVRRLKCVPLLICLGWFGASVERSNLSNQLKPGVMLVRYVYEA